MSKSVERRLESQGALPCGHPVSCISEMLPDFIGDTPETQLIGTVHCRWCADVARAEAKVKELEEIAQDFGLVAAIVQEMAAANPGLLGVWTGTVSERLNVIWRALRGEKR